MGALADEQWTLFYKQAYGNIKPGTGLNKSSGKLCKLFVLNAKT